MNDSEADKEVLRKIRKQLEFYFSDSNLRGDKFMKAKLAENADGYVKIDVLLTFNRLKAMTTDTEKIKAAVRESEVIKLSDDGSAIKRLDPLDEKDDAEGRTVFVDGLAPAETIETLAVRFADFGKVLMVRIPTNKTTKEKYGFAFVEFSKDKEMEECLKAAPDLEAKHGLKVMSKMKHQKMREEKKRANAASGDHARPPMHTDQRGVLMAVTNADGGVLSFTHFDLKEAIAAIRPVAFVDLKEGQEKAIVRFREPADLKEVDQHMHDHPITLAGKALKAVPLSEDEEKKHWEDVAARAPPGGFGGGGRGGRGGRGGGRGGFRGGRGGGGRGGPRGGRGGRGGFRGGRERSDDMAVDSRSNKHERSPARDHDHHHGDRDSSSSSSSSSSKRQRVEESSSH